MFLLSDHDDGDRGARVAPGTQPSRALAWAVLFSTLPPAFPVVDATADGGWVEAVRFHYHEREGFKYYGCWFYSAVGAGTYFWTGRRLRVRNLDAALWPRAEGGDGLLDAWLAKVKGGNDEVSSASVGPEGCRTLRFSSDRLREAVPRAAREQKEIVPYIAYALGYQTILADSVSPGNSVPLAISLLPGCMTATTPVRACPRAPLRQGGNASRPCVCNQSSYALRCLPDCSREGSCPRVPPPPPPAPAPSWRFG